MLRSLRSLRSFPAAVVRRVCRDENWPRRCRTVLLAAAPTPQLETAPESARHPRRGSCRHPRRNPRATKSSRTTARECQAPRRFAIRSAAARCTVSGELQWRPQGRTCTNLKLESKLAGLTLLTQISRGGFDADGHRPRALHRLAGCGAPPSRRNFQRDAGKVTFSGSTQELPLEPGVQDRVSWDGAARGDRPLHTRTCAPPGREGRDARGRGERRREASGHSSASATKTVETDGRRDRCGQVRAPSHVARNDTTAAGLARFETPFSCRPARPCVPGRTTRVSNSVCKNVIGNP